MAKTYGQTEPPHGAGGNINLKTVETPVAIYRKRVSMIPEFCHENRIVLNATTQEKFETLGDAARSIKVSTRLLKNSISDGCTCGGYDWRYEHKVQPAPESKPVESVRSAPVRMTINDTNSAYGAQAETLDLDELLQMIPIEPS